MNHYWVEKDRFLAGEYPRDKDERTSQAKIDALIQLGVSAFIDLTHDAELNSYFINRTQKLNTSLRLA